MRSHSPRRFPIAIVALCAVLLSGMPRAHAGGPPMSDAAVRALELDFARTPFPAGLPADAALEEILRAVLGEEGGPALVVFEACAAAPGEEDRVLAPHPVASLLGARFSLRDFVGIHVCRFMDDEGARARLMVPRFFRMVLVDLARVAPEQRALLGAAKGAAVAVTDARGKVHTRLANVEAGREWDVIGAMRAALDPALLKRVVQAGDAYLVQVGMAMYAQDAAPWRKEVRDLEANLGMLHAAKIDPPPAAPQEAGTQ